MATPQRRLVCGFRGKNGGHRIVAQMVPNPTTRIGLHGSLRTTQTDTIQTTTATSRKRYQCGSHLPKQTLVDTHDLALTTRKTPLAVTTAQYPKHEGNFEMGIWGNELGFDKRTDVQHPGTSLNMSFLQQSQPRANRR